MNAMRRGLPFVLALMLAACAQQPTRPVAAPAPAAPVVERVAERALASGIAAYDDGRYAEAETQFGKAIDAGLASPRDRATAQKYLAFIYCTSKRTGLCLAAFRAARDADPAFALSKSEAGHPLWGPVYRRTLP